MTEREMLDEAVKVLQIINKNSGVQTLEGLYRAGDLCTAYWDMVNAEKERKS